ncbi:hypothetical protein [Pseudorhodoferax sp.]|uniref:hypothetical protein n=1 Tax=Pseudorhodoferax sp. TaxID=1993553 RepID=UPI002DD62412|nr:hypothetical protein [Pseudorhodoferax sp.]
MRATGLWIKTGEKRNDRWESDALPHVVAEPRGLDCLAVACRSQFALAGGNADTAITHGPFLIRQTGADGTPEYTAGRFSSVWKRKHDGVWYVLFDGGGQPPRKIDAAQAQALFDDLPTPCTQAGHE